MHAGELRNFHIAVSLERGVIWTVLNGDTSLENRWDYQYPEQGLLNTYQQTKNPSEMAENLEKTLLCMKIMSIEFSVGVQK